MDVAKANMKPFGALPRPRSRFRRPFRSWLTRLARANGLRLGFLVVYLMVALGTLGWGWHLCREYGYFYSPQQRFVLWQRLPEDKSLYLLALMYRHDNQNPYMAMLELAGSVEGNPPELDQWLRQPGYRECAEVARRAALEHRLTSLEKSWRFARFESLEKLSEQGQLFNTSQRERYKKLRSEAILDIVQIVPDSNERATTLSARVPQLWKARPPLDNPQRSEIAGMELAQGKALLVKAQEEARAQLDAVQPIPDLDRGQLLATLRRLQLAVCLHLNPELQKHLDLEALAIYQASMIRARASLGSRQRQKLECELRIQANCRKISPRLQVNPTLLKDSSAYLGRPPANLRDEL